MSDCPRFGKLFGGCKFSPRYDLGRPDTNWGGGAADVCAAMEVSKPKTYVRDVCERCGRTVEREASPTGQSAERQPEPRDAKENDPNPKATLP